MGSRLLSPGWPDNVPGSSIRLLDTPGRIYRSQSLGKMVLNIAIVGADGETIGFGDAALERLGKAFLPPIDCFIGLAVHRGQGQRAFNMLSRTIVVSASDMTWCT